MAIYSERITIAVSASRARGDRLDALYRLCESRRSVSTDKLLKFVKDLHESDKIDAIHFRDLALKIRALKAEIAELKGVRNEINN